MKNRRGFMLIETLVASTIILGALIFLFVQFSSIKRAYETSFKYNTIPGLYNAKVLTTFLEEHGHSTIDDKLNSCDYVLLTGNNLTSIDNCSINMVNYSINAADSNLYEKVIISINTRHILYVGSNITGLQQKLKASNPDPNIFNEGFRKFILQLDPVEYNNFKRVLIEYKNNTYAVAVIS